MSKGKFRLEQVLNLRKEMENLRRVEFSEARGEYEGAADRLQSEEEKVERLSEEMLGLQQRGLTAGDLLLYADFYASRTRRVGACRNEVELLGVRMAEKREVLVEASRDKKVLESLREKTIRAARKEEADRERAFIEELTLQRSGSRR